MATGNDIEALGRLLSGTFSLGASDLHLKAGGVPMYRMGGTLRPVEFPEVESEAIEALSAELSGRPLVELRQVQHFEFSCTWRDEGRFRGHYYRQRGTSALALRAIPLNVPSLNDLRLPPVIKRICDFSQGLVLVTGATGMGKSTTVAAMLATVAQSYCRHIVTVEDPIEYILPAGASSVAQREVGDDVESFASGLEAALRQDPDVLMLGEIRDRETMDVALRAATTGHLVFSTAHFADATTTIEGIVAMSEARQQGNWRYRMAHALRAVVSQRLLPRRVGRRVLATEVLINEPSVRACILDEKRTSGLRTALARGGGKDLKTHTFDQTLLQLLESRVISLETAQMAASSPADLMREANLRRLVG